MGIGMAIRAVVTLIIVALIAFAGWYVTSLKADLAVSQENTKKMIEAVEEQKATIAQMQKDQADISRINKELAADIRSHQKDVKDLEGRFNTTSSGQARNFGAAAAAKPESIQRAVNRGTKNALRCLEIASGSSLTDSEKNAKTEYEINKECPSLANPNYTVGK